MDYSEFKIDAVSTDEARRLADKLRHRQDDIVNRQIPESFRTIFGLSTDQLTQRFAEPLEKLEKEMALNDVRDDVVDFGLLTAAVARKTEELPVMLLDAKSELAVPLLPPRDALPSMSASELFDTNPDSLFSEMMPESRQNRQKYVMWPIAIVKNLFYAKLRDFVTARIAGTRWHERQVDLGKGQWTGRVMYASAGGTGGGTIKFKHPERQEWKVHGQKSTGRSVYYTSVAAARPSSDRKTIESIYLNGLTPWVDVLLNYGEVYLGSDIGPSDDPIVWDGINLVIPRPIREGEIPIYHAMRF